MNPDVAQKALEAGLNRLVSAEPDITNYDTIVGDGDCGIGLRRGAEGKSKPQPSSVLSLIGY